MQINLQNQIILVTGASRGIGKAIAHQLLESGAKVALHYSLNEKPVLELKKQFPEQTQIFQADLEKQEDCTKLFQEVLAQFGDLDGLVNNAGVAIKSPIDVDDAIWMEDWEKTQQINLSASAYLSRKAVQYFIQKEKQGRLVFISSRAAFRGDTAEYWAYAASKAGMVALSHTIARAYGKKGIKSFVIAPGFIQTNMAQDFIDEYGEDYVLKDIALPTLTQPENLAPMVALLLSGLADHTTGSTISINAGSYVH